MDKTQINAVADKVRIDIAAGILRTFPDILETIVPEINQNALWSGSLYAHSHLSKTLGQILCKAESWSDIKLRDGWLNESACYSIRYPTAPGLYRTVPVWAHTNEQRLALEFAAELTRKEMAKLDNPNYTGPRVEPSEPSKTDYLDDDDCSDIADPEERPDELTLLKLEKSVLNDSYKAASERCAKAEAEAASAKAKVRELDALCEVMSEAITELTDSKLLVRLVSVKAGLAAAHYRNLKAEPRRLDISPHLFDCDPKPFGSNTEVKP
jgi:hypothetical protein